MKDNGAFNLTLQREKDVDTTSLNIEKLNEDEKREVAKICDGIKFDHESISLYGKDVTKKLNDFSTQILDSVKVKDAPEIEGMLLSLVGELDKFNTEELSTKKRSLLGRLFGGDKLDNFINKYKSISAVIADVKGRLEEAEYQLQKDIKVSETYLLMNRDYINELDKYILAGDIKIREKREEIEREKESIDTSDMLLVQELAVKESDLNALERKIHNLRLQRAIAIQNIPQLMMIKDGDAVLVAKIDDSINQAIPLWESQIVIGISAMRQQAGVAVSKSVTDTTNNLLRQNAAMLKESAIGVATENERDIVEIETLRNSNNALIETINAIREIKSAGAAKREQSIKELASLQKQLNQALIEMK